MKVETQTKKADFHPIEMKITFTSLEEASKFYAMFNHATLRKFFGMEQADLIREDLMNYVKNDYLEYHSDLCDIVN